MRSLHNNDEWNQNKKAHIVLECSFAMQCSLFLFCWKIIQTKPMPPSSLLPPHTQRKRAQNTHQLSSQKRELTEKRKKNKIKI